MPASVYVQTNDAANNEIIAFGRSEDGSLAAPERYATGGRGTGEPHLPSQSSVALSDDGRWLLVVNAGSDELSLFAVEPDGLRLADRVDSGGGKPTSVAVSGALVYVLNNGTPNISRFNLDDGKLTALEDSTRPMSGAAADPAQISFSADGRALIATERGTNSISSYAIGEGGYAAGPRTIESSGQTYLDKNESGAGLCRLPPRARGQGALGRGATASHRAEEACASPTRSQSWLMGPTRQVDDPASVVRQSADAIVARLVGYENVQAAGHCRCCDRGRGHARAKRSLSRHGAGASGRSRRRCAGRGDVRRVHVQHHQPHRRRAWVQARLDRDRRRGPATARLRCTIREASVTYSGREGLGTQRAAGREIVVADRSQRDPEDAI
jgi:hypothetical protein